MRCVAVGLLLCLGCRQGSPTQPAPKDQPAAARVDPSIHGKWRSVSLVVTLPKENEKAYEAVTGQTNEQLQKTKKLGGDDDTLEVTAEAFRFGVKKVRVWTAVTDASKDPKTLDLDGGKDRQLRGIYKVEDGKLVVVLGEARPEKFHADFNRNGPIAVIYERVKE